MEQYQIKLDIYCRLHKKYPWFANNIKKMKRKAKYEKEMISLVCIPLYFDHIFMHIVTFWQLRNTSWGACSDNSNSLLSDGLEYVSMKCGPLDTAVLPWQPKADVRGFNHPMLAQLLCPVDFLESFDEDPERCGISSVCLHADNFYRFCNKLVNGSIKVHSMDFPLCLYNKALIDKEDPSAGLMQSKLLVAVHFIIFVINYDFDFSSSISNTYSLGCQLLWRMGQVAAKRREVRPKKTTWRNQHQVWLLMLQPR